MDIGFYRRQPPKNEAKSRHVKGGVATRWCLNIRCGAASFTVSGQSKGGSPVPSGLHLFSSRVRRETGLIRSRLVSKKVKVWALAEFFLPSLSPRTLPLTSHSRGSSQKVPDVGYTLCLVFNPNSWINANVSVTASVSAKDFRTNLPRREFKSS